MLPLRLQPVARSGRTVLLVLFLLLTLAAITLGVVLLRGGVTAIGDMPKWNESAGTVSGWEGVVAERVVIGR